LCPIIPYKAFLKFGMVYDHKFCNPQKDDKVLSYIYHIYINIHLNAKIDLNAKYIMGKFNLYYILKFQISCHLHVNLIHLYYQLKLFVSKYNNVI
jgi:hypothetical protein